MADTPHTTGNDPLDGVDPGGTHSTKPGNPDKSGPSKPQAVEQTVISGDRNAGRPDELAREPGSHRAP